MVLLLIGKLILGPGCWNQVHPLVTDIPVDWEYTIPYGLIYAMDPPEGAPGISCRYRGSRFR